MVLPESRYVFASDREAEPIALKCNGIGLNNAILWYTIYDHVSNIPRNALVETAKAIQYIREHGEEQLIDLENIIVCGFSAGGHLAIQIATRCHQEWLAKKLNTTSDMPRVNLGIPCYASTKSERFKKMI